eukprot:2152135-Rhodomonas_salina.1
MASLTLGPALKLQADCYLALKRQGAQWAEASTAPAGRRRPRKGNPKRFPFDNDVCNDELADDDCSDEVDSVSPHDSGNDCDTAWSDRTQSGLDAAGCNSTQHLGDSEGMMKRDTTLGEPDRASAPRVDEAGATLMKPTARSDTEAEQVKWDEEKQLGVSGSRRISW